MVIVNSPPHCNNTQFYIGIIHNTGTRNAIIMAKNYLYRTRTTLYEFFLGLYYVDSA